MAQGTVEQCIGRLLTDEASRVRFGLEPEATLADIARSAGGALTAAERAAIRQTTVAEWNRMADAIDPRLQRLAGAEERQT